MTNNAGELKKDKNSLLGALYEAYNAARSKWMELFQGLPKKRPSNQTRKFDDPLRKSVFRLRGWAFMPTTVIDDRDRLIVRVEASGLREQDLDVEFFTRAVKIRGVRFDPFAAVARRQITAVAYGSFCRYVSLPASVEAKNAKIGYRDGVLRIELVKTQPAQHRFYSESMS